MLGIEYEAMQLTVRALERECHIQYEWYLSGLIDHRWYRIQVMWANQVLTALGADVTIIAEPSLDAFRPFIQKGSEAE